MSPDGELLYVFSTATPFEPNTSYRKFDAYSVLNHTGDDGVIDWRAASRELAKQGYGSPSSTTGRGDVVTVRLSEVEPEEVEFAWDGWIAFGKLSLLVSDPEMGKSTISCDLAARTSTGQRMPMSTKRHDPMDVIFMTAEDGLADTVVPRLLAAGADLDRVEAIMAREQDDGYEAPISFPEDVDALRQEIDRTSAGLVIIDPLNAFLTGKADSYRDHHVRRALSPLARLAEDTGVAMLIICHLNKQRGGSALYRVGGSIGLTAAARAVLLVGPDPEDEEQKVLAMLKSNLAPKPQSLTYRLVDNPEFGVARVKWEKLSNLTAADLLMPARQERDHPAWDEAEEFLVDILSAGAVRAQDVKAEAVAHGISETTLQRVKQSLGVESPRVGFGKGSHLMWSLPAGDTEEDGRDPSDPHTSSRP